MKFFRRKSAAAFFTALALTVSSIIPVFAEGSKELTAVPSEDTVLTTENPAYRPYLDWRDRDQFGMPSKNIIYAYANEGETIFFGSDVTNASDRSIEAVVNKNSSFTSTLSIDENSGYKGASIAVTLPAEGNLKEAFNPEGKGTGIFADGDTLTAGAEREKVYLFNVTENGAGHISNRTKEQNGPNGVVTTENGTAVTDGYEPLSFVAPYTGTYAFRFLSSEYAVSDLVPTAIPKTITENNKASVSLQGDAFPADRTSFTPSPMDISDANNLITVTFDSSVDNNRNRGWYTETVADDAPYSVTIDGETKTYTKRLQSTNATTLTNGYLSLTPKHYPYELKIVWSFMTNAAGNNRSAVNVNGDRWSGYRNADGDSSKEKFYADTITNLKPNEEMKITFDSAVSIYAIEYSYIANDPTMAPEATVPPTPTREPLDRKVGDTWAKSPSEVAAWDVTVASTSTSTGSAQSATSIVWNLYDEFNGIISTTSSKDGNLTLHYSGNALTASTDKNAIKINAGSIKNGVIEKNIFEYTPKVDGTIKVTGYTESIERGVVITTDLSSTISGELFKAKKTDQVFECDVTNNIPIYIYATVGGIYYKTIEFIPKTSSTTTSYTAQSGRVWSDILFLNAGAYQRSMYSKLNVLTEDGFLYDFKFNGIQPYSFVFYANNRGFLFDPWSLYSDPPTGASINTRLQSLERSFYSNVGGNDVGIPPVRNEVDSNGNPIIYNGKQLQSTILGNYEPVDSTKDFTHQLFLNTPDSEALTAYTGKGVLKGDGDNTFSTDADILSNLKYVGVGNQAINPSPGPTGETQPTSYGTMGIGGRFEVELKENQLEALKSMGAKNISVTLDFSGYKLDESTNKPVTEKNNNIYEWKKLETNVVPTQKEANNKVTLTAAIADGVYNYTMTWDGKDAYGNDVPEGVYSQNVKSFVELGMVHFPILDAEHNPNGIKLRMANTFSGMGEGFTAPTNKDTVYYNNAAVSPKTNAKDPTNWLYNSTSGLYPSKIGDGQNMLGGVSSNYAVNDNGAMIFGSYEGDDVSLNKKADAGYGNNAALDIWTKYEIAQKKEMTIGVKAVPSVPAYVSFVAENGTAEPTATDTPFTETHLKYQGAVIGGGANIKGQTNIYGNTISTGFLANVKTGSASNRYITWEITIPKNPTTSYGDTYIKIPRESGSSLNEIETAELYNSFFSVTDDLTADEEPDNIGDEAYGGEAAGVSSDDTAVDMTQGADENESGVIDDEAARQFLLEAAETTNGTTGTSSVIDRLDYDGNAVLADNGTSFYNAGAIHRVSFDNLNDNLNDNLILKIKQKTEISGGTEVVIGLVIDNLYAPNATAKATYGDEITDSAFQEIRGAVDAASYQGYLKNDNNKYDETQNKNYVE